MELKLSGKLVGWVYSMPVAGFGIWRRPQCMGRASVGSDVFTCFLITGGAFPVAVSSVAPCFLL